MEGTEIKRLRKLMGMSQEKLARELGVSFCTVNRWERGRTVPSPMAMEKLSVLSGRYDTGRYQNSRSAVRLNVTFPIMVQPLSGEASDLTRQAFQTASTDLGLGGLKFNTDMPLENGDKLRLYIDVPGSELPVKVISDVRWHSEQDGAREVGVKFSDIHNTDMDRIKTAMLTMPTASC